MNNRRLYQLNHCTYDCQYHLVWITKWRGKVLSEPYIKRELTSIFIKVARWKGCVLRARHIGEDHIHLIITIPPKHSVSFIVQFLKGKSFSWIKKKTKKFPKGSLWARGYFVSTIGLDEAMLRNYVKNQHTHHRDMPKLPI